VTIIFFLFLLDKKDRKKEEEME